MSDTDLAAQKVTSGTIKAAAVNGVTVGDTLLSIHSQPVPSTDLMRDVDRLAIDNELDVDAWVSGHTGGELRATLSGLQQTATEHRRRADLLDRIIEETTGRIHDTANHLASVAPVNVGRG